MPKANYTARELFQYAKDDLLRDAAFAEKQAQEGPFYPEKGITKESLIAYAAKCRSDANLMGKQREDRFVRANVVNVLSNANGYVCPLTFE